MQCLGLPEARADLDPGIRWQQTGMAGGIDTITPDESQPQTPPKKPGSQPGTFHEPSHLHFRVKRAQMTDVQFTVIRNSVKFWQAGNMRMKDKRIQPAMLTIIVTHAITDDIHTGSAMEVTTPRAQSQRFQQTITS